MRTSIFALVLVAACSLGCGEDEDHPTHFAYSGSNEGLRNAQAAAAQWQAACAFTFTIDRDVDGVPMSEVPLVDGSVAWRGSTDRMNGKVTGVRFVLYDYSETTLAHELGHVLGLPHASSGIMIDHATTDLPRVTQAECDAVRSL